MHIIMSSQVVFRVEDLEKKYIFSKKLKKDWLNNKSFFNFCIDEYINNWIKFGIINNKSDKIYLEELSNVEIENTKNIKNINKLSKILQW